MRDLLAAALSDHYALERELGRGGMASVWLAEDRRLGRAVAIKVLHPELAGAIGVDRFVREIRLTARLQHPGIVPVLDSGTFAGPGGLELPWYAMAYVPGESLRARLDRERQLPVEDALRITGEVADALAAAHRDGIVHRDIKPENLLLSGGRVCVADFGIARALLETGGDRLTSTGIAIGTPAYMSPEQATADAVDARTDQYSLATVLYEMLTGETPFAGPTAHAIMARRMSGPPRPIHPVRPAVPAEVEAAVQRALELVPADRFAGVTEFARALHEGSGTVGTRGSSAGRRVGTGGRQKSRAGPRWLGAVAVAALAAAGWLMTRPPTEVEAPRDPELLVLYQRGVTEYEKRLPGSTGVALQAFTAAVQRDSNYAPAWAGLAKTYVRAYARRFVFSGLARDSVARLAVAATDRALALDPRNADAWLARAMMSRTVDPTDDRPGIRAARQALAIDSSHAEAWLHLATSQANAGDMAAAMTAFRRSVAADPSFVEGVSFLALGHYWQRQFDSAAVWADSAVALNPSYLLARTTAGLVALAQGNLVRAGAAFDAALRLSTDVEVPNQMSFVAIVEAAAGHRSEALAIARTADSLTATYQPVPSHNAVYVAEAWAALGDGDRAIAWLQRYTPRADTHFQMHLQCDPLLDPLSEDPRFRALLLRPRPGARGC